MAMLKLTLAMGGLKLSIPSHSVRTVEGIAPGAFADAPEAGALIRYLIGNQLRTRVAMESHDELMAMIAADRVASASSWITADMQNEQAFSFQPRDVAAAEDLDPDLGASKGCNLLIDLDIEGVPVVDLYVTGDGEEIRAAAWPEPVAGEATIPTRRTARKRPASSHAH